MDRQPNERPAERDDELEQEESRPADENRGEAGPDDAGDDEEGGVIRESEQGPGGQFE